MLCFKTVLSAHPVNHKLGMAKRAQIWASLRCSPKSPPGKVPFYTPIQMHGRRGHKQLHPQAKAYAQGKFSWRFPPTLLPPMVPPGGGSNEAHYLTPDCSKRGLS